MCIPGIIEVDNLPPSIVICISFVKPYYTKITINLNGDINVEPLIV